MSCSNDPCSKFRMGANNKITIQVNTPSSDDYGGRSESWATETTPFAMIEPLSGRELFELDAKRSRVTHRFTIRYQAALKSVVEATKRRISFDGRLFSIQHSRNLDVDMKGEGKQYQQLYAVENSLEFS